MRLQPLTFERGLAKAKSVAPFGFRDHPAKPLFDKGLQSRPFSLCHRARLGEKAVWDLYGRFHMASHTIEYTKPSSEGVEGNERTAAHKSADFYTVTILDGTIECAL